MTKSLGVVFFWGGCLKVVKVLGDSKDYATNIIHRNPIIPQYTLNTKYCQLTENEYII